jgi:class I lanthipeptide synthase
MAVAPAVPGPAVARAEPDLLAPGLRQRAAEVGLAVCERLRGQELPQLGPGLASGWSGLAVLFEHADRCRPGEGWAEAARDALGRAARTAAADPRRLPPGLAAGWAGVAFASAYLGRDGQRYQGWRRELAPHLKRAARAAVATVRDRRGGWPFADFDHIAGLAGMVSGLGRADAGEALGLVTGALAEGTLRETGRPPWHTAPDQVPERAFGSRYPGGMVNLGMAHGLAGVVAALAVAAGSEVAGGEAGDVARVAGAASGEVAVVAGEVAAVAGGEVAAVAGGEVAAVAVADRAGAGPGDVGRALGVAAGALAGAIRSDDGLVTLPHVLPLGSGTRRDPAGRTAWCYGPPGAARALGMAGAVLDSPGYARLAAELLVGSLAQPARVAQLETPSFCHGVAGVLQIAARMATETGEPRLAVLVPELCEWLLDRFEPDSRFGFQALGPRGDRADVPGLLDGAAGVGLVLLSVANPTEPRWDRAFLLS